jgi:hypothetical protein
MQNDSALKKLEVGVVADVGAETKSSGSLPHLWQGYSIAFQTAR